MKTLFGLLYTSSFALLGTLMAGCGAESDPATGLNGELGDDVGRETVALNSCPDGGYTSTPGLRIKGPDSPRVYLVDPQGRRRWIPDGTTYEQLFRSWGGIQTVNDVRCILSGPDLNLDGVLGRAMLVKSPEDPKVYLWTNGKKFWIVSPGTMEKYYFAWNKIMTFNQALISRVPDGGTWD